jgi:hypothetical protein
MTLNWHIEHVATDTENDVELVVRPVIMPDSSVWHWALVDRTDDDGYPLCVSTVPGFDTPEQAVEAVTGVYNDWLKRYLETGEREMESDGD